MTWRCVKIGCLSIVAVLVIVTASYSDSSMIERRDKALKEVAACLKRDAAPIRECKNINKNMQTLMDVYKQGDRSVLPTLLQFSCPRNFLGDALIDDTEGFLSVVANLPEVNQQAVALSVAGRPLGLERPRFEQIRATLMTVPDSSPNYAFARTCLRTLETVNAALIENYLPPQTFGDRTVHSLSMNLHALEEKPLWPPALDSERTYRVTILPAFAGAQSVTLTVLADGSGHIGFRATDANHQNLTVDSAGTITPQQVSDFTSSLNEIQFWKLPAELRQKGFDGADWIVEAVQDGKYHIVLRWSPDKTPFGAVGRSLFELAGHKMS
jgi:hypothetical protein